jgi:hypothetical protein
MGKAALAVIVALTTLFSLLQTGFVFATTVQKFSLDDIAANIRNISPSDNGSYIGDIGVNITVHFSGYSRYKPLIPYQEINCLIRVDNGEWQNASLVSASPQKHYGLPANRVNVNYVDCIYNATLNGLSNGAHLLDIDLKPDIENHVRTSSNGTIFGSEHSSGYWTSPRNAPIVFYVSGYNNESTTTSPQPTNTDIGPFVPVIVLSAAAIVATVVFGYFKKYKIQRTQ